MNSFKLLFLAITAILISIFSTSCDININTDDDDDNRIGCVDGRGDYSQTDLVLDDFDAIELRIDAEVRLTLGNTQQVTLDGQRNITDLIDDDVDNKTWVIEFFDCVDDPNDLVIYITVPDLEKITVRGSGSIISEQQLDVDDLEIQADGSADIDLELDANEIDLSFRGSGDVKFVGETDELKINIAGSGDVEAFSLTATNADIKIDGSGDVDVRVTDNLDVTINGSGDVNYKGNPTITQSINGSGDLNDAN